MVATETDDALVERPKLTFAPEVCAWVEAHYAAADVILEYGSGGSTVLGAEMPGKTLYSVESSRDWHLMMQRYFEQNDVPSPPELHYVNIGETGKWGLPVNTEQQHRYHKYPLAIWDQDGFRHPDLILIDGRFRVACALTAMLRCTRKATILFDDYRDRKRYQVLEEFLELKEMRGYMARFEVEPTALPRDKMTRIIGLFARPF
jgi:hypothetical protein